jgi:hypothetical protein
LSDSGTSARHKTSENKLGKFVLLSSELTDDTAVERLSWPSILVDFEAVVALHLLQHGQLRFVDGRGVPGDLERVCGSMIWEGDSVA